MLYHKGSTLRPCGCTMVAVRLKVSTARCTGPAQKTKDAKVLNRKPAPYSQHSAGKVYRMACSDRAACIASCGPQEYSVMQKTGQWH